MYWYELSTIGLYWAIEQEGLPWSSIVGLLLLVRVLFDLYTIIVVSVVGGVLLLLSSGLGLLDLLFSSLYLRSWLLRLWSMCAY